MMTRNSCHGVTTKAIAVGNTADSRQPLTEAIIPGLLLAERYGGRMEKGQ